MQMVAAGDAKESGCYQDSEARAGWEAWGFGTWIWIAGKASDSSSVIRRMVFTAEQCPGPNRNQLT